MTRADVTITAWVAQNHRNGTQSAYVVKYISVSEELWYYFYIDSNSNLFWTKSNNLGLSWNDPTAVTSGLTITNLSVWFDKWTPGNTGTLIHLAYIDSGADDVLYRNLDVSTQTLGTQTVAFAGSTTGTVVNTCIALTRAIGGNLYCLLDIDGGTEIDFVRSVDVGANWTSRTGTAEGADYFLLAPGFAADTQDIICIFWDRSASEISRKLYDDSANSWAESSIAGTMTAIASTTCVPQFSITVDDANNKILLAAWSNRDTANADLRFWTIDESTITEGTNIVLNSTDDQQMCALSLATDTNTIYAFYGGKSDGSETAGASINLYYTTSTDGGTTWGAETQVTEGLRNFDMLFACPVITGDMLVTYQSQNVGPDIIMVSYLIPAGASGGLIRHPGMAGGLNG
jgi:hypothetical protein